MADGEHYRGVSCERTAVTETILRETAKRRGATAMGILSLGAPWRTSLAIAIGAAHRDGSWRAAFDRNRGHNV
jgi:hypothetical protein